MLTRVVSTYSDVADVLRTASDDHAPVRIRGGGTKMGWGGAGYAGAPPLSTLGLDKVLEHNAGDLTAVVQAGVRLADAQRIFAESGQMLALDPPLGPSDEATVGGIVATADSGPLRHGYGGVRDQVIGIRAVLPDGSLVHSGGKVIKNVAGYDLGKLFAGSFGTLGVIVEVSVRLSPLPANSVTAVGNTEDPGALGRAAVLLSNSPIRASCLDFVWNRERGRLLAGFRGGAAGDQARRAKQMMAEAGLEATVQEDDEALWAAQRAAQRSAKGVVVKASALPADLPKVIGAAERTGAKAAGRAGLGLAWISLPEGITPDGYAASLGTLRDALGSRPVVVQDAPPEVKRTLDVWGAQPEGALGLMRRLKVRFDPWNVCNRGIFVGGI